MKVVTGARAGDTAVVTQSLWGRDTERIRGRGVFRGKDRAGGRGCGCENTVPMGQGTRRGEGGRASREAVAELEAGA